MNSTNGLTDGVYTYQAFVSDTSSNLNQTEERTITIDTSNLLTSCQNLSTAGTYVLQNDILGIVGDCFTISADDITLDGNGFTIDGVENDLGVTADERDNLTIKNFFNITDFRTAIRFSNINNSLITNNTFNSNEFGIRLGANSNNNIITNNTANSNTDIGIRLNDALNTKVTNNTANSNSIYGIQIGGTSNNNQFLNNQITNNTLKAINDITGNFFINYLIYNNSFGDIRWNDNGTGSFLRIMDLNGSIGLGINLTIGNNTVFLDASAFTLGLINSSANITLYGMDSFSFSNPVVLRNGLECTNDECYNFTHLDVATIKFNVTYAGANYTIGEEADACTISDTTTLSANLECTNLTIEKAGVLNSNGYNITVTDSANVWGALNLNASTVLNFSSNGFLEDSNGTLSAIGNSSNRVTLTGTSGWNFYTDINITANYSTFEFMIELRQDESRTTPSNVPSISMNNSIIQNATSTYVVRIASDSFQSFNNNIIHTNSSNTNGVFFDADGSLNQIINLTIDGPNAIVRIQNERWEFINSTFDNVTLVTDEQASVVSIDHNDILKNYAIWPGNSTTFFKYK